MLDSSVAQLIRDVPDFPRPGIIFKDITPALQNPDAFRKIVETMEHAVRTLEADAIVGIESRGFLFGAPLALRLERPFVPIRKVGKLPFTTLREQYSLEYGVNAVEIHSDGVAPGQRVIVVDDLLATGGTAAAAGKLIERLDGVVAGYLFFIELDFLNGREALAPRPVISLVHVGGE